jgi:predicted permease
MRFESLRQDVSYAIRGLRAKPGFALAVITTIALGIGANAAMFGIVDRLLFRPPALMKDPATAHRVYLFTTYRGEERISGGGQFARYRDIAEYTHSFSEVAGYTPRDLAIGVGDAAREMRVGVVSANFFRFFDAPPVLGRYFTADEDLPPAGVPVAVLSYAMWQTQYGASRSVLGTAVQIGPTIYTVIGVSPPGFVGLWADKPPAAFIPLTSYAAGTGNKGPNGINWWETYSWGWMNVIVRRKPGVSVAVANADLTNAFLRSMEKHRIEQPRTPAIETLKPRAEIGSILSERGPNASAVGKVATWVGGVSVIVLLIACANVANLLLARALRRKREIALRLALGVSRGRLFAQLLTESVLLALLGGAAGMAIAHWGGAVLRALLLEHSEAASGMRDPRTVVFAAIVAVLVGLLTGLAPILQASRANLTDDLKAGTREGTYTRSRTRLVLLVMQGALSVVLLVGAGLFVRSLSNVRSIRLGYDVDPIMLVNVNMRGVKLDSMAQIELRERLLRVAEAVPGVEAATRQAAVPFWSTWSMSLFVEGIDTVARLGQFDLNMVSKDYFRTMGTRIIRGRGITDDDVWTSPRIVVVSDAMGKVLWPGRDAIGQCLKVNIFGGGRDAPDPNALPCTTVVGIAENIKEQGLAADSGYYYYLPITQARPHLGGLLVRVRGDARTVKESVRRALQREMPGASYVTITSFQDIIGGEMRSWQLGATMFVAFGLLAIVLAAIGLYSVIAYNVTQRIHEIGVRRALGAQAADVARLVVSDGLRLVAVGVGLGVAGAIGASRWIKPLLFDVSPNDPAVYAFVAVMLALVAIAASWLPARRASRVDPSVALRSD